MLRLSGVTVVLHTHFAPWKCIATCGSVCSMCIVIGYSQLCLQYCRGISSFHYWNGAGGAQNKVEPCAVAKKALIIIIM